MADSAVVITAGTGTNIDTRTEATNGNHRQVIVIGDPATNAGVAPVDATYGLSVDVTRSALPSGAATSAKQDTIIGHVDNVEGLLTTIDADTSALAGAIAGTEVQVDIVGSLPAGSNAIGKLAANSGVDIGDVDVTSVIPGTGATNLGKAIDTATGATDTGVLLLATRDDALSALTPIEGDNVQLRTNSTGALWVAQSGTVTVDGSGVTQPVSNAGLTELAAAINSSKLDVNIVSSDVATGGTSAADDADFTATTTPGTPAMGVYESTPTSVTDGDLGVVGITTGRRMKTSATIDSSLPAGTNNIGDVDVLSSALPTGASTSAKQDTIIGHLDGVEGLLGTIDADTGSILTSVELIDDTVTTLGTTTYTEGASKGVTIGAVRRDADTSLVDTTNEFGPLQMDANGRLKVEVFSGEALPVTMTSTTVTGTVAVTQSGTWDEVGINDSGNSITVDNGGTFAVQVDGAALTSLQLIDDVVYTDDTSTHSTGTSKGIGMMGVAVPTDTSISANDIGMVGMSTDRRLYGDVTLQVADTDVSTTNPVPTKGVPSDIDINGSNANHAQKYYTNAGAVTDGIIWSPAAGKRWHVLTLYINVSAACTVTLEDDLAGGDSAVWKGELAANSGVVLTYDKEHPFSSTEDAADLIITTTAGNVYVQAVGYEV